MRFGDADNDYYSKVSLFMKSKVNQRIDENYERGHLMSAILSLFSFELWFVLFVFAGLFKADPRLEWVPVDLTGLFLVVNIAQGLMLFIKHECRVSEYSSKLFILYLAFCIWVLCSLLWTLSEEYALLKTGYLWTLGLWSISAPLFIISREWVRLKRLAFIFFLFSVFVSIEIVFVYFGDGGGVSVFGSTYLGIGRFIGLSLTVLIAYFLIYATRSYQKVISVFFALFFFWILIIGGGRGPFLSVMLAIVPLVLYGGKNKTSINKFSNYYMPILLILAGGIAIVFYYLGSEHTAHTLYRFGVLFDQDGGESAMARIEYYDRAVDYWTQSPIIGHGIGAWPILINVDDIRAYPHNIVLEMAVELGIIGLLLFSIIIVYTILLLKVEKNHSLNSIRVILLMLLVFTGSNSMVSGDILDNRILFVIMGLAPSIKALLNKGGL